MSVVRALDVAALALAAGTLGVIVTGGLQVGGLALTRPEDFLVAMVAIMAVRALVAPIALPRVHAGRAVAVGVAVYLVLMGFIVVTRHLALRTHALDLGQIVQVVWNIAHGYGPMLTQVPTYVAADEMNVWGDHLYLILYLFVPLQWIAPGPLPLLVAQTVILGAGGLAVFAYARRRVGEPAGVAFALLYLANPSLHGINVRDIHSAAFAIPLIIAAAVAFDAKRYGWCVVALVATLAGREDAAVAVVGFAVWLALARGRWLAGAALAVAATTLLAVDIAWVMPRFLGGTYNHLNRYQHLGGSLGEILVSIPLRPWRWVGIALTPAKLVYLGALLAPLALLPLLAPRVLAAALPGLAMNLLSLDPKLFNYQAQYQAFVLPFLVLAAVDGYARLREAAGSRRLFGRHGAASALGAAFVFSVVLTARIANDFGITFWRLGPPQRAAYALMARIPDAAAVAANERLVPHLATRREIYVFPRGVPRSEYILHLVAIAPRVPANRYDEIAREGQWALWRRRAQTQ